MADLDIRTALTQLEVALQTTIENAIGKTITVADLTALRALASNARHHGELAYVSSVAYRYRFNRFLQTADNGTTVIKPTDNPTAGRWQRTTSTSSSGYLKQVKLWEGERDEGELLAWLFGNVPSVIIVWESDEYEPRSAGFHGLLYWYKAHFSVWAVSRNLRGEKQGATGSQISTEATADPGVNRIIGDLRRALAGSDLSQDGVESVEIVSSDRVLSSATTERGHVYRLGIRVDATLHNYISPDDDATSLTRIDAEWALAQEQGAGDVAYPDYYIVGGFEHTDAAPMTGNYAAGSAYINGTLVSGDATTIPLPPGVNVYRILDADGVWRSETTLASAPPPTVDEDEILIGVSYMDPSSLAISDRLIAPYLTTTGITDEIDVT